MPDTPDAPYPHDFGFQSSDQAGQYPRAYGRYDAPEANIYTQGDYATPNQAFPQEQPSIYPDYSLQQPQQIAPGQVRSYHGFDPNAQAAAWNWTQSVDFTDFTTQYEPQGELIQELHNRKDPTNEFSVPLPVNSLPPPPRPLPPAMKRKSEPELYSAIQPSTHEQQNPSKRRVVSRASSTASQASPAPTILADAQPSPMASTAIVQAALDSTNQSSSQGNSEAQQRRDASKGTGPQGRVIDVSEPRRVAESSGDGDMLPAGKVFPIQIGSALFRLSGASLSSDGTQYDIRL
jgi:hypothetical protein